MSRETDPVSKKKPWEEMTPEEQQQIKESWKVELPEQFDVCCNSNFIGEGNIHIPGRFYVQGNCYYDGKIIIDEDFIVDGNTECFHINVEGCAGLRKDVYCRYLNVAEDCTIFGNDVEGDEFHIGGNFSAEALNIAVTWINVRGKIDFESRNNHLRIIVGGN